jgi:hypothetical protein
MVPGGIYIPCYSDRIVLLDNQILFMSAIDWIILCVTLAGIVVYGIYKSRTTKNLDGYFLSNRSLPW